jgi:hypothetical protein
LRNLEELIDPLTCRQNNKYGAWLIWPATHTQPAPRGLFLP